jgi:uncharacterized membrane protein
MKNNLNRFLLTVMFFAGMVLTTFWQLITSNLIGKVLVEKKELLAGAKVFIKNLLPSTAYVTYILNDEYSSSDHMKLQHLFI